MIGISFSMAAAGKNGRMSLDVGDRFWANGPHHIMRAKRQNDVKKKEPRQ